mmetsp:Transcript_30465/g.60522  ORF Transcript_30465/g.60522 Transcript_30465/m.60522 type:complete len:457 (+) Transcript_30465:512-1882(+)
MAFPAHFKSFTWKHHTVALVGVVAHYVFTVLSREEWEAHQRNDNNSSGDDATDLTDSDPVSVVSVGFFHTISIWALIFTQLAIAFIFLLNNSVDGESRNFHIGWFQGAVLLNWFGAFLAFTPPSSSDNLNIVIQVVSALMFCAGLIVAFLYIMVLHSIAEGNMSELITQDGFYLIFFMGMQVGFPQFTSDALIFLSSYITSELVVILSWQFFIVVLYMCTRLIVRRGTNPWVCTPLLLPVCLCGDFMLNLIFLETDWRAPVFWIMLLLEIGLLIVRDCHLYEDLFKLLLSKARRARFCLRAIDTIIIVITMDFADKNFEEREENGDEAMLLARSQAQSEAIFLFSEVFSTVAVLFLVAIEITCNETGFGAPSFSKNMDKNRLVDSMVSMILLFVAQLMSVVISNRINHTRRSPGANERVLQWKRESWKSNFLYFLSSVISVVSLSILNAIRYIRIT